MVKVRAGLRPVNQGNVISRLFDITNIAFMVAIIIVTIYPFWYTIVNSFNEIDAGSGLVFLPHKFTLSAYDLLFKYKLIWTGYKNTVVRTLLGTVLSLFFTMVTAYPLSKRDLPLNRFFMKFILITMLFSGGLIPTYLQVKSLGLLNSVLALVLPGLLNAFNIFIVRNFYWSIPASLEESAFIDGAGWFRILFRIVIPLSKPVLATIALWVLVGHWNAWFDAMIYITDPQKTVVQVILRRIALERSSTDILVIMNKMSHDKDFSSKTLESAIIVITILPMLIIYPFLQKYFVKGIMIGAIKG